MKRAALLVQLVLAALLLGSLAWAGQRPTQRSGPPSSAFSLRQWETFHERLKRTPGVARYYTFQDLLPTGRSTRSVAGGREAASYAGPEPFELTRGRWPGKKAVRLDRGAFQAKPVEPTLSGFSFEMWFCKHGQGAQLGNGRTNGMLFAQGNGYWEGLRVWSDYPAQRLRLEWGRPKPRNAVGVTVPDPVPDGVWQHLAVTWDGQQARVYLNGLVCGVLSQTGPYTPPKGSLRIGYADAGIGSLKLDVDEFVAFGRCLSASEVLEHALLGEPVPGGLRRLLAEANEALAREDWSGAVAAFTEVVERSQAVPAVCATARLGLALALRRQNRLRQAAAQCVQVFTDRAAPAHLRDWAARSCLVVQRGVAWPLGPRAVYERLLRFPDLTVSQRVAARLCLAECCLADGDAAAAREQYQRLAEDAGVDEQTRRDCQLQVAHTFRFEGRFNQARQHYAELAGRDDAPPELRGLALLALADTYALEKRWSEAAEAFARAAADKRLLPHHRWEANQREQEMRRLAKGLPAVDPNQSRTRVTLPKPAVRLFVAPNGSDANPGTKERPFATLERARDAVRQLKRQRGGVLPPGGVEVVVRGGRYEVRKTLELTAEDSGTANAPVVYAAYPGERPVFSGAVRLTGVRPVSDPDVRKRLPSEVRDRVLEADLKANGVTDWGELKPRGYGFSGYPTNPWVDLYVNGQPFHLARWPNKGFVSVGRVLSSEDDRSGRFTYDFDRPDRWQSLDDVWVLGYWRNYWAARMLKVERIDRQRKELTTAPGSRYGFRQGQPYYFFNVLEELDEPGEWYLDRRRGRVYFLPFEGPVKQVDFPVLKKPFVRLTDVRHVVLRGLTFELGQAEGVVIEGGSDCLLAGCTLARLGANGAVVLGGRHHGLLGCDIFTVGAGGVRMAGGDPKTLTPGRHFVENCHIYDFSRVDRVYAPAVHLDGCGNRIAHNLFHDSPHHALRVEGFEHTIEFNEVHSVVYEASDQAGIDIYGNPVYRGLVIRYNFWHHIGSGRTAPGEAGIRLDDFISSVLIYGNVFFRCAGGRFGGVQIHGGKDNIVDNNLFVQCKQALSFSPWGEKRWRSRLKEPRTVQLLKRYELDAPQSLLVSRYPDLAHLEENADRNFVWRNVVVDCGQFTVRDRGANEMLDNHVFSSDPGFRSLTGRDFTLPPDSPVFRRFGFRPIPFDQIGLYPDQFRATWPVRNEVSEHYVREY